MPEKRAGEQLDEPVVERLDGSEEQELQTRRGAGDSVEPQGRAEKGLPEKEGASSAAQGRARGATKKGQPKGQRTPVGLVEPGPMPVKRAIIGSIVAVERTETVALAGTVRSGAAVKRCGS